MQSYPLCPRRLTQCLDGAWRFAWRGEAELAALTPLTMTFDDVAAVPGVWDTTESYHGRRGVGVYQRRVHLSFEGRRTMRLRIGALSLRGRVWWDGAPLGDISTAYGAGEFDVQVTGGRDHVVTIACDNRFDEQRSPLFLPYADFYAYGGIFRSVTLAEVPDIRIERAVVTTLDPGTGRVLISMQLGGHVPPTVAVHLAFDDAAPEIVVVRPVAGRCEMERSVAGAGAWTPEHPELHTLRVQVGDDEIVERFGLRTVGTCAGRICLNGRPVRLRGVNLHEAHPQFGPVRTPQSILQDLALIKALGCNFVRLVHYPHDPVVLDLCDEVGLLVWEESLAWGLEKDTLLQPEAQEQLLMQTTRMVREGANHPSVIIWAFLNECASDALECQGLYAALAEAIRREDATRLVSYASNRIGKDLCLRYADVVSVNLYPGWIWPQQWDVSAVAQVKPFVEATVAELAQRDGAAGKPLLLSEIGACGLYGCRDRDHAQWSEEFQADFMSEAVRTALSDGRWAGVALWQFCDTRSFVGSGSVRTKPRGFNLAGLVDEYRRPKLAYDAVRDVFVAAGNLD